MNELKVGMLALASILGVVLMTLKVTSNQSGFGEYVSYRTILNDASGIFPKTPIKVAGINSGRIKTIELLGNQALITFEVLRKIKITKGSMIRIKSVGFLGDKYIDVFLGEDGPMLPESSLVQAVSGGGLEDLSKDAGIILNDLRAIVASFRDSLAPVNKESPLKSIVKNIEVVTENAREITESLKRNVVGNEKELDQMVKNLHMITENLNHEMDAAEDDSLMQEVKKVGPIMDDLKKVSNNLNVVIQDLRDGKGTVGKLLRDEQVVDQVNTTLAGVNRIVNRINDIQTEIAVNTGVNTEEGSKSEFNLNFWTGPERVFRFGLISAEFGRPWIREITTSANGRSSVETRQEVGKNTYRFNAQLGRKYSDFTFRLGLIETSGGVGVDYDWQAINTRIIFEAFDYRKDFGPNLRLMTDIHVWNVIYGRLAVEDMVNKKGHQSFTAGLGLRFTDEDIKSLLALIVR